MVFSEFNLDSTQLNKYFLHITCFIRSIIEEGLANFIRTLNHQFMASSAPRYQLNKTKYLLPPETERLRKILTDFELKDPRNCLMIGTALRTGARAQEVLNITRADLNPYDETIFIRGLKNSNDREIPVHSEFFGKLHRFAEKQGEQLIFPITYTRLYQIWENYRPIPKKFHALRHTFAIELYKKTKDLRLVQVALGHRNITNTMVYADYVYSQQELRRLIL